MGINYKRVYQPRVNSIIFISHEEGRSGVMAVREEVTG